MMDCKTLVLCPWGSLRMCKVSFYWLSACYSEFLLANPPCFGCYDAYRLLFSIFIISFCLPLKTFLTSTAATHTHTRMKTHILAFDKHHEMSHVVKLDHITSDCQHSCSLKREDGRFHNDFGMLQTHDCLSRIHTV